MSGETQARKRACGRWSAAGLGALLALALFLTAASSASAATATRLVLHLPATATAGTSFSATVIAVNADGSVDTSYHGDKSLAWSGAGTAPNGTAPAFPANPVSFDAGAATVSITLYKAETATLGVTDGSISGSAALTVVPGAPALLAFVQQPTETQVNSVINATTNPPGVRVQAKDGFGNFASNTTVAIAIGLNPPGDGVLSGTTVQPTDGSGIAVFGNLSINQVGVGYTLVASAPSVSPTATATSAAFIIAQSVTVCSTDCSGLAVIHDNTQVQVGAHGTVAGNTLGIALVANALPPHGACPGFSPVPGSAGTFVNVNIFGSSTAQPTLTFVWTLDKSIVALNPRKHANQYELCLGALNLLHQNDPGFNAGWTTKQGTPAVRLFDPVFNVNLFWGIVADCPKRGTLIDPCVVSKVFDRDNNLVVTYVTPYPWDANGWLG
jgi:hypothetical protein